MDRKTLEVPALLALESARFDSSASVQDKDAPARPSARLFSAALIGLLGMASTGCDDEAPECEDPEHDAGQDVEPWQEQDSGEDTEQDAGAARDAGSASHMGGGESDAARADGGVDEGGTKAFEVLREVEGDRTLASLKAECDTLKGYMQVHASCSGSNDCAGFSYGDWDPGVYSEHTCAAANGCVGASCVVLPKDSGKSAEDIMYAEELPLGGPQPCWFCHTESTKQSDGSYSKDKTKFKVWVPEGSSRNETNWLDLSPQEQAAIVAFGRVSIIGPKGQEITQRSMKGYHKLYSRAEIERVVDYIRKLAPVIKVIKAPK